ncbi:MAG: polysaccharide deacetylase family protein, partial [Gammaproteobacteria bacterium]|nr:polysaccharide deacetylase family protein [Gammaproteobacteria bacterium]
MNTLRMACAAARAAVHIRDARLSILIYHRVLGRADPFNAGDPDIGQFRWQMQTLKKHFRVIDLEFAVAAMRAKDLPKRAACVTFDDGYADNLLNAAPILHELAIPATFFIA